MTPDGSPQAPTGGVPERQEAETILQNELNAWNLKRETTERATVTEEVDGTLLIHCGLCGRRVKWDNRSGAYHYFAAHVLKSKVHAKSYAHAGLVYPYHEQITLSVAEQKEEMVGKLKTSDKLTENEWECIDTTAPTQNEAGGNQGYALRHIRCSTVLGHKGSSSKRLHSALQHQNFCQNKPLSARKRKLQQLGFTKSKKIPAHDSPASTSNNNTNSCKELRTIQTTAARTLLPNPATSIHSNRDPGLPTGTVQPTSTSATTANPHVADGTVVIAPSNITNTTSNTSTTSI